MVPEIKVFNDRNMTKIHYKGLPKLLKIILALKREHPALQHLPEMSYFFFFFEDHFCLPGAQFNPNSIQIRIRNTERIVLLVGTNSNDSTNVLSSL
jgi:hypothetical protein